MQSSSTAQLSMSGSCHCCCFPKYQSLSMSPLVCFTLLVIKCCDSGFHSIIHFINQHDYLLWGQLSNQIKKKHLTFFHPSFPPPCPLQVVRYFSETLIKINLVVCSIHWVPTALHLYLHNSTCFFTTSFCFYFYHLEVRCQQAEWNYGSSQLCSRDRALPRISGPCAHAGSQRSKKQLLEAALYVGTQSTV